MLFCDFVCFLGGFSLNSGITFRYISKMRSDVPIRLHSFVSRFEHFAHWLLVTCYSVLGAGHFVIRLFSYLVTWLLDCLVTGCLGTRCLGTRLTGYSVAWLLSCLIAGCLVTWSLGHWSLGAWLRGASCQVGFTGLVPRLTINPSPSPRPEVIAQNKDPANGQVFVFICSVLSNRCGCSALERSPRRRSCRGGSLRPPSSLPRRPGCGRRRRL